MPASPAPRIKPILLWGPWATSLVASNCLALPLGPLRLGWFHLHTCFPTHQPEGGLDHSIPDSSEVSLGLCCPSWEFLATPWCLWVVACVWGWGVGVGRMPGPSLLSSRHLLDNAASFERLEMNNSIATRHLESTCPPPVLLPGEDENTAKIRRASPSKAGQVV